MGKQCCSMEFSWCWGILVVAVLLVLRHLLRSRLQIDGIHRRHVFITGCDTGFGRLLTESLDKKGVTVYAGCLSPSSVQELKKSCSSRVKPVVCDVTSTESIRAAAAFVERDLDGKALWAIVNNAGVGSSMSPFEWTSRKDARNIIEVNLLGPYDVTLAFLPMLRRGKEGRIINMASSFGRVSWYASGYPLSKHGVEALSDGLSCELRPFNITVHTLEPGYFPTNFTNVENRIKRIRESWGNTDPKIRKEYGGEEFLEEYVEYTRHRTPNSCPDLNLVVEGYEHAILSKYPQNRYAIGSDARFFDIPMSWLPFRIQMCVLRFLGKFSKVKPPVPKNAVI